MNWNVGDWCIHDLDIVQIKRITDDGIAEVSDGMFSTSGRLLDRLRPLTLQNKNTIETLEIIYKRLNGIDGEGGFNWPDIHRHFCKLALERIDTGNHEPIDKAGEFVNEARDYKPVIQGVSLFRPSARQAS